MTKQEFRNQAINNCTFNSKQRRTYETELKAHDAEYARLYGAVTTAWEELAAYAQSRIEL